MASSGKFNGIKMFPIATGPLIINPRRIHRRVTVFVLCVCLSVIMLAATYLVCESNFGVVRFLMAFQTHDLCGFH